MHDLIHANATPCEYLLLMPKQEQPDNELMREVRITQQFRLERRS